jgi:hypothetical protein
MVTVKLNLIFRQWSLDSSVGLDIRRIMLRFPTGTRNISLVQCSHRLWGPYKSMQCGYSEDVCLEGREAEAYMLTTRLHVISMFILSGALPPLAHVLSWLARGQVWSFGVWYLSSCVA